MVGLRDPPPNRGLLFGNTDRFVFVDGNTADRQFFTDPFEFPWSDDEPDDGEFRSDCVR